MPKKTIKRFLPDHHTVKKHKHLQIFGSLLHDPNLWHLNRRSASGAFAVGLFFAWCPVPFQMFLAAMVGIGVRVNLPLSVGLVWVSNPFTMPPLFYGAYMLGAKVMGIEAQEFKFELSWQWLTESLSTLGPAFLLGCLICGVVSSLVGYTSIRLLWRYSVISHWKKRQQRITK